MELKELKNQHKETQQVLTLLRVSSITMETRLNMDVKALNAVVDKVETEITHLEDEIKAVQNRCPHIWKEEYGGCHYLGDHCCLCGMRYTETGN